MKDNCYVSSLAFTGSSPQQMIEICRENDLNMEFSSGMDFQANMEEVYLNASIKRMPHNYFPPPKDPFVLNLASANEEIRRRSIEHCKRSLELAQKSNSPFFAAHAGFCIDPKPSELGRQIEYESFDKEKHKKLFLNSVREILELADELQIDFLIENNVLAPFNYSNGENFLLCCEFEEISWLFREIDHPRLGLLLDTAHLKVSCQTLDIALSKEFKKISNFITAFHHSDNDGQADNNKPVDKNYWYREFATHYKDYIHVLEVKDQDVNEINYQLNLIINDN